MSISKKIDNVQFMDRLANYNPTEIKSIKMLSFNKSLVQLKFFCYSSWYC